jgi:hypothetical protein
MRSLPRSEERTTVFFHSQSLYGRSLSSPSDGNTEPKMDPVRECGCGFSFGGNFSEAAIDMARVATITASESKIGTW